MSIALSGAVSGSKTKTKISLLGRIKARSFLAGFGLFALTLILAGWYFCQINALSTDGYEIDRLKTDLTGQQKRNQELELAIAELQSRRLVFEKAAALGLVAAGEVDYLSPIGSVAVR